MVGCVLSQLKPSELYILSCRKGLCLRPRPFSQLIMYSSLGFILYKIMFVGFNLNDEPVYVCITNNISYTHHKKWVHTQI